MENPQAFPRSGIDTNWNEHKQDGMTLLDYFAGQCLLANLTNPEWLKIITSVSGDNSKLVAKISYEYANAMLEEKEKYY